MLMLREEGKEKKRVERKRYNASGETLASFWLVNAAFSTS